MATLHLSGQQLSGTFTNHFLAHLQVATAARFGQGKGYFLTTTGRDSDGAEVTHCHWLHPAAPLTFRYDLTDDSGDRLAPVRLDPAELNTITESMDQPTGVRGSDGIWWPFAQPI